MNEDAEVKVVNTTDCSVKSEGKGVLCGVCYRGDRFPAYPEINRELIVVVQHYWSHTFGKHASLKEVPLVGEEEWSRTTCIGRVVLVQNVTVPTDVIDVVLGVGSVASLNLVEVPVSDVHLLQTLRDWEA